MKFLRISVAIAAIAALALPGRAQEETWKSIGTGTFRENFAHAFYTISEYPELEVEVQESEQTPGRYRIVNPYADYPDYIGSPGCYPGEYYIVVDASDPVHCYIETSKTGYQIGGHEMLIVGSQADDYYNNRYGNWTLADRDGICGKLVDGSITFPPMSLLAAAWNPDTEWNDDILWLMTDSYGMFRLRLPGAPDLDITTELNGINDAHTMLSFAFTLGGSIEKALVALVPSAESEGAADRIISGEIPSIEVTLSGNVDIPYQGDGNFTLFAIPYCEGTPRTPYTRTLDIQFDESEWRKCGTAFYREGIISAMAELIPYGYVFPTHEYFVDVEENVQRPGYIRLVDAYGDNCPLRSGYYYDDSRKWYLYIDATDTDRVRIEKTPDGVGLDLGYGKMLIWSKADRALNDNNYWAYGYSDEQIRNMDWYGLHENDEITFPKSSISIDFPAANPNAWYEANSKGEFLLRFQPGQIIGGKKGGSGISEIVDNGDAPAVYYNLDGVQVPGTALTPGIYVVRQGSEVRKIIIR